MLRVLAGFYAPGFNKAPNNALGDGVNVNDAPFRSTFPYVATPTDGFSGIVKRTEPAHAPVPQPPTP